jgi:exodeoxyribonuclease VII small subunit
MGNSENSGRDFSELTYEQKAGLFEKSPDKFTYELKVDLLDEILGRLDNYDTPIDQLASEVKLGVRLIKDLGSKLKQVETEVRDAFKELEEDSASGSKFSDDQPFE